MRALLLQIYSASMRRVNLTRDDHIILLTFTDVTTVCGTATNF